MAHSETTIYPKGTTMLKDKLVSVKNHVFRNRGKYSAIATLTVCTALHTAQVKEVDGFLKEHNLFDKYYALDEN